MGLLRTDASDPLLDLGGSVMMDNQLTDSDAWRSRQTSGLMTVDHEQLRDESKQSKALDDDDDDDDKLPTTYQVSDPRAVPTLPGYNPIPPIVPSYKPTSWGFQNHCNLLQAMGPPDGKYDLGSFSDEESDEDIYCKVCEFSDGSADDGNEKLPTTYQPDASGYQTSNNLTHAGYDVFRATASSFFNNPRSFTEEETKTYNKIVQETDGFGSIYVPPGVSTPGLLMPAKIENVGKEGSMMLDGLAELAVVRYNEDNETSYQVVKIIRVNVRFDGWMFYNMTFQARDDKARSLPRNFQARIRRFGNQTKVDFCRFEEEPKPIQGD
ncbi:hypothetical protein RHGRI_015686 [Rhododendron griersonianum]|uniref:Uncharacterized protein n=1 Tax=Rhododendron griersonianum TaxID=479676 RepID=A0AAV6KEP9_9ERIC|nr:hypothetical protein RHGRI_015686 [Rhododendron griersonianum]